MGVTVINDSGWVEDVNLQMDGEDEASCGTSFLIKFDRSIAVDSLIEEHFLLYNVDAESYVSDPWTGIVPERDYSFIYHSLELYLLLPLDITTTYRLVIRGLEDGAGQMQTQDHIVEFITSAISSPVDFRLDETPAYVEDFSIIEPDTADETGQDITGLYVLSTTPPDDTIQVDGDALSEISVIFSLDLQDVSPVPEGWVTVEKRYLDSLWHPYEDAEEYDVTISGDTLTISFTLDATPEDHYLDQCYEYRVTLSGEIASADATPVEMGEDYEFCFYTRLVPLYIDPRELLGAFPGMSLRDLILEVYKASQEAVRFASSLELEPETMADVPHAAQEYVRCRSVYLISLEREQQVMRTELADFSVTMDSNWVMSLKDQLQRWQNALENLGTSGMKAYTKSKGRITIPEQSTTRTGSHVRDRNSWWDDTGSS